jgi:hypothetical protein
VSNDLTQWRVHVISETLAVLIVVPFSVYVASRKQLPAWARVVAGGIGVATLLVDGYLLTRNLRRRRRRLHLDGPSGPR